MSDPNHITRQQLAALIGANSPSYINELAKTGRAFKAPCGKLWLKAESLAAWKASRDPAFQGVADRHAAARAGIPQGIPQDGGHPPEPTPDEPPERYSEYNFQDSKAKREFWAAAREHSLYLKEARQLMAQGEVVAAFAQAGSELRQKLERWQTSLPPQLAERDEATIRATLIDQTERILLDIDAHFLRAAESA
jgi:hypothetical protein